MPGRCAVRADRVPTLRQGTDRRGPRTDPSSSLGTPRHPTDRYRISTAPTHLFVRLLHQRRVAGRGADWASRTTAHRLYGVAHRLVVTAVTPGRALFVTG